MAADVTPDLQPPSTGPTGGRLSRKLLAVLPREQMPNNKARKDFDALVDSISANTLMRIPGPPMWKQTTIVMSPGKLWRLDKQLNGVTTGEGLVQLAIQDNQRKSSVFASVLVHPKLLLADKLQSTAPRLQSALRESSQKAQVIKLV